MKDLKDYLFNRDLKAIDDDSTILQLKKCSCPCILWGAGEVAEKVWDILSRNDISIDSVWVDEVKDSEFHGIRIKGIEEILSEYNSFNVIIGHNRYDKIEMLREDYNQINDIFFFYNSFDWEEGFDYDYFKSYEQEFQKAFELAEDSLSRKAFSEYVNSRISLNPCYVTEDCIVNGYFKNDCINISDSEIFLEIGAFNGNIVKTFYEESKGLYNKIIALEPDDRNFYDLKQNVEHMHDVVLIKTGCWNNKTDLRFSVSGTGKSNHIDETSSSIFFIPVDKVDNILNGEKPTVINLFCQTGLHEILEGARKTLSEQKPKLIIGIGLRKEQSYLIPQYIKSLNSEYRIYYRFYGGVPSRFYLIAI